MPVTAHHKAVISNKKNDTQSVSAKQGLKADSASDILHSGKWWQISSQADKLIDEHKYNEAEKMLIGILPKAKKEAPQSLDYALALCRLSTDLYALKKYSQALERIQEAIAIVSCHQVNVDQHRVMWRCMLTKVAILLALRKDAEAEMLARKTVAYTIAFPNVATAGQTKTAYRLLNNSLEAQKKLEGAKRVSEIMNQ